jgi:hypothetical protein
MAVTANQIIKKQDGCRRSYPVEASTNIYQGTLVFINATGNADDDTGTGVNAFAGVAVEQADNSSGSAGDKWVEVYTEGDFELTGTGLALTDNGMPIYADDNYACVLTLGSTSVRIGTVVRNVSSTKAIVAIKTSRVGALEVAPLTTISITDAAGTPDYALSALTTSSPYGLATAQEAISLLYVIKNLQQRVLDLEKRRLTRNPILSRREGIRPMNLLSFTHQHDLAEERGYEQWHRTLRNMKRSFAT